VGGVGGWGKRLGAPKFYDIGPSPGSSLGRYIMAMHGHVHEIVV